MSDTVNKICYFQNSFCSVNIIKSYLHKNYNLGSAWIFAKNTEIFNGLYILNDFINNNLRTF